jgi:hypothetical protein
MERAKIPGVFTFKESRIGKTAPRGRIRSKQVMAAPTLTNTAAPTWLNPAPASAASILISGIYVSAQKMAVPVREQVWTLLSDLFVDTSLQERDLRTLGRALRETGASPDETERVLRTEVAPVCGRWMLYGAAVGAWPAFDEVDLKRNIEHYIQTPWYRRRPLLAPLTWWYLFGVRRDWQVVRDEMQNHSS